jgi:predicted phage terminase large subunit-like protein
MFGPSIVAGSGKKIDLLLIEDKGSGISLRQMLEREGVVAYAYNPGNADKLSRLHMVSHIPANGLVWLPESQKIPGAPRTWAEPLLAQLCVFTGEGSTKHDDFVDSTTQAWRLFADKNLLSATGYKPEKRDPGPPAKPKVNPYAI